MQFEKVLPFVEEYVKSKDADLFRRDEYYYAWSNDYIEYFLTLDEMGIPQFKAYNVEIVNCLLFAIPVIDKISFLKIMALIG